ncbi:MAG: cysteine--tRNA ligase [Candidatus Berkelbacteria bacterium]|nr:cysteine--tRNA ligase [Candidatus Berkelbacteria bacterium]
MKKIAIYNTLTRSREEIVPESDQLVRIYSCGLTVYDFAHIGNLRKYVFDDLLRRTLLYFGYKVKQVMNITDVGHLTSDADEGEDKVEAGAKREKKSASELAEYYEKEFVKDLKSLNVLMPDLMPRATDHIKEQIELVKTLEKKDFTYKTSDGVYFDTSRLPDYGKLAKLKTEGQEEGKRVEKNPEKKNPTDFALWKFSPSGAKRQMEWESPWGVGFPGWHLECSAMSTKYLGQPFEIHTGGVDHISVHHTNEIAQSEAAAGKPLAKYWLHSDFLLQGGKKMAKSEGHFIRLQDIEKRGFEPLDFRMLCLGAHYRSKLDFSWEALRAARMRLVDLRREFTLFLDKDKEGGEEFYRGKLEKFENALTDDLNTPKALAVLSEAIASREEFGGKAKEDFAKKVDKILGLNLLQRETPPKDIIELVKKRKAARLERNFKESDRLRIEINKKGWEIDDLPSGGYALGKGLTKR